MKILLKLLVIIAICMNVPSSVYWQVSVETIEYASSQMKNTISDMNNDPLLHPNQTNISDRFWKFSNRKWWTSGFFAGTSWYLYELVDKDSCWLDIATRWTEDLELQKNDTGNQDVGFQIFCSFGNGYRLTKNEHYKNVIITAANSLATRYDESVGAIRSWSWGSWNYPVIIDNMMNLELLLCASKNG